MWRGARYAANFDPTREGNTLMYQPPTSGSSVQLEWQSADPSQPLTYHVYRSVNGGARTRLTASPLPESRFSDPNLVSGSLCYAVSAVDSTLREGRSSSPVCVQYASDQPGGLFDPNHVALAAPAFEMQAHPNPFNPSTAIELRIPVATTARLAIYDVAGRLVQVLHAGHLDAGTHRFGWNTPPGTHVASGSFFAELKTPAGKQHRTLIRVQ